jgi:cell division protein FtsQ
VARSYAAQPGSSGWAFPVGRFARSLPRPLALARHATPRRLAGALAALALLGGGWLWLRDSSLVAVEHVQIRGVQGVDAGEIDAALQVAARRMSTLNVNVAALRAAVKPFRVVRDLSVSTSFPHGLRIDVVEQLPVAVLSADGVRTAAAADGVVLGSGPLAGQANSLPAIALASPAGPPGAHVRDATTRAELSVLGAAPGVLLGWVAKVYSGSEGLTVAMRGGVSIYFGAATRARAKWLAAARVLADPSSAGATYVDVRDPERPAAGTSAVGGLEDASPQAGGVSAGDPTSAVLANALAEAVSENGGAVTTSPSGASPPGGGASAGTTGGAGSQSASSGTSAAAPGTAAQGGASAGATSPSTGGQSESGASEGPEATSGSEASGAMAGAGTASEPERGAGTDPASQTGGSIP